MSWRDNLREASFRGVVFHFQSTDAELGRRTVTHEYPGRDIPHVEDLGRKARTHTIDAYVLEPGHLSKAAALRGACEQSGPGTLVHPYLGEMQASCTSVREHYTTRDGGKATFQLSFTESGDNRYPSIRPDTAAAVSSAADDALNVLSTDFAGGFNVSGFPGFVTDAAGTITDLAGDDILTTVRGVITTAEDVARFTQDVIRFKATARTLMTDPATLADSVIDLIKRPGVLDLKAGNATFEPLMTFGSDLGTPPRTTPSRIRQSDNQSALTNLIRRTGLVERIRAASGESFTTRLDAVTARDSLSDLVDGQTLDAGAAVYRSFATLQQSLVRHVSAIAPALPRVVSYTPTTTRPSLTLAHELYGDDLPFVATRADEIAARNRIRHPGLVGGGNALEVLSHG